MSFSRSRDLRVLQICHDYEGPFRFVCRQYCEAFPDANVTTIYLRGESNDDITKATGGDRVIYLESQDGSLRGIKFSLIFRLGKIFREDQFDVVIAHRYKSIYLAGIISYFFGSFLILGVAHEHNVFRRITRAFFVTFWRRRIHLIAVSKSVARNIASSCPSLIDQGRLHTVGNAMNEETRLMEREAARRELGLRSGDFVFGTVGRLIEKKKLDRLLVAFANSELGESCVLAIVGAGPQETLLHDLAESLGIAARVVFTGHVDQAVRCYSGFDCFVFSAGDEEAFGMVILEAMFAGLPILASDAPGPDDVLGDIGIRFSGNEDLANKLKEVYEIPLERRFALGEAARQRFEHGFTFQQFAKNLWRIPALSSVSTDASSPSAES